MISWRGTDLLVGCVSKTKGVLWRDLQVTVKISSRSLDDVVMSRKELYFPVKQCLEEATEEKIK